MSRSSFLLLPILLVAAGATVAGGSEPAATPLLPGFSTRKEFDEQESWFRTTEGIRVYLNAPLRGNDKRRTLVVYATPNGNTIEQTLGCQAAADRDWHFDIQHVAAQIRRWREISPDESFALAVTQAPQLSWPAFRQAHQDAGLLIRKVVQDAAERMKADRVILTGHSGGGSFIFGYIESAPQIDESIARIAFLDANYSYSDDKHGEKLNTWLRGDKDRRLVVIAYDDREITLNGKRVVGPAGGTFRASQRMLDWLSRDITLAKNDAGPFVHHTGMNGQVEFFVHPNPENKILHTALVGEMNGLLHGLTLGGPLADSWGKFGGPRAYASWIQSNPAKEPPAESAAPSATNAKPQTLSLPPRPADSPTGSQFFKQIESLDRNAREAAILHEIARGNVPDFLRTLTPIELKATDSQGIPHAATCYVTGDYLAVGTDEDFFRVPMTPMTAQAIADTANASLITTKLSDEIFRHARIKLDPRPLTKDRDAATAFFEHHNIIEQQRRNEPLGTLIAGIKKDVVLTNRLNERPHKVAIYGWHYPTGKPIQPLYVGHVDWYVDYSHGIRLLSQHMVVDGQLRRVTDILHDPLLSVLLSDEGPITAKYEAQR